MKASKLFTLAFLALFVGLASCKKDKKVELYTDKMVDLKVAVLNGNNEMALDDTVKLTTGFNFKLQLFRVYISNVTLIKVDGTEHLVKDVDILSPVKGEDNISTLTVPYGDYKSIRIGYGLDPEQNLSDPTSFEQDHPLSNYQNMYWPMINYRFLKMEGQSTKIADSTDYLVAIHPGKDALYKVATYDFASTFEVNANTTNDLLVSFEINDIFDGPAGVIDFSKEGANQVHMEDPMDDIIGERFMENFTKATNLDVVPAVQ